MVNRDIDGSEIVDMNYDFTIIPEGQEKILLELVVKRQ
jgi:hypothetical protein